jgi:hypothetical protein
MNKSNKSRSAVALRSSIGLRLHLPQRLAVRIKHVASTHPLIKRAISLVPHPFFERPPLILSLSFLPESTSLPLNGYLGFDTTMEILLQRSAPGRELLLSDLSRRDTGFSARLMGVEGNGTL